MWELFSRRLKQAFDSDEPVGITMPDPVAEKIAQIDDQLSRVTSIQMRNWLLDERLRWKPVRPAEVPVVPGPDGGEGGSW